MSFAALFVRKPENVARRVQSLTSRLDRRLKRVEASTLLQQGAFLVSLSADGDGPCFHNLRAATAGVRIVGRARIYNSVELAETLDLSARPVSAMHVLLAAYTKWGADLGLHLIGDFSFAIWDSQCQALLAFRDQFGVKPLFYELSADAVLISDEERVFDVGAFSPVTKSFVHSFLQGTVPAGEETAHPGVRRVLPGHKLEVSSWRAETSKYWSLEPANAPTSAPEREFRARFVAAVEARAKSGTPFAAMLSGGLDSSSIAAVLRQFCPPTFRLPTYSMIYGSKEKKAFDESSYINILIADGGIDASYIFVDDYKPMQEISSIFEQQLGLFQAPGLTKTVRVYERLQSDGIKRVFDGHGGDEVVWYGSGRIIELAVQGHWLHALALVPSHARLFGDNPVVVGALLVANFAPLNLVGRAFKRLARTFLRRVAVSKRKPWQNYLNPAVLEGTSTLGARQTPPAGGQGSDQEGHLRALASPFIGYSFEVLDKAVSSFGIEVAYPFFDTRLATFCLGLPASEKLRRGQSRSILRRAMEGLVPAAILSRQDKTNFANELAVALVTHHSEIVSAVELDPDDLLSPYVNREMLPQLLLTARTDPASLQGSEIMLIWRLCCLYCWLQGGGSVTDEFEVPA